MSDALTKEETARLFALATAAKRGETVDVGGVVCRVVGVRVRISRSGALVVTAETEAGG